MQWRLPSTIGEDVFVLASSAGADPVAGAEDDGRSDKTDVRSVSSTWVTKAALLKRWGGDARKSALLATAVKQYERHSSKRVGAATTPRKPVDSMLCKLPHPRTTPFNAQHCAWCLDHETPIAAGGATL